MKYLKLVFPILIFAIGVQFLLDHFVREPANLATYEKLISSGKDATAILSNEYSTVEVAGVESESKTVSYTYNVNGKEYTAEETVTDLNVPADMKVNIKYLPSDPSISSMDPAKALEHKKNSAGNTGMLIGLAAMLIGAFLFITRLRSFKNEKEQQA